MKWELMTASTRARTSRLKVKDGWLVLVERSEQSFLKFLSDPNGGWQIPIAPAPLDPHWNVRFLHLTSMESTKENPKPVQVNIGEIGFIEATSNGTKITLKSGPSVTVKEPDITIFEMLRDRAGDD